MRRLARDLARINPSSHEQAVPVVEEKAAAATKSRGYVRVELHSTPFSNEWQEHHVVKDGYWVTANTGQPLLICSQCGIHALGRVGMKCQECKQGKFRKARA
jgi:hypothetical protein